MHKYPEKGKRTRGIKREHYPWLDTSNERKYMMDKEILDKYMDLDKSSLRKREERSNENAV